MSPVPPAVPIHNLGRRLLGAHRRRVERPRSGALLEGRHAACHIACVALAQILQKGGQCSSDSFFFQLFIPTFRTGLRARGEEYFELGIGEHDRAHVAPLGDQPRGLAKGPLPVQKSPAHPGQGRYPRGGERVFLGADGVGHALGLEEDLLPLEASREPDRDRGELRFVAGIDSLPRGAERHQPVQGAAVEVVKAERLGDPLRAPTCGPSAGPATSRSVSLTRQLAMLRRVLVPSAKSAAPAAVIAASGMGFKSASMAFSFPRAGAPDSIQSSPIEIFAPIFSSTSVKRISPWMLERPTPCTRTGPPPIAPAARKYEAEEASPSTRISPGLE